MIFALLAQYYAMIPHTFRFRIGTTTSISTSSSSSSAAATTSNDDTTATNQQSPTPKPAPPSLTLLLSDKIITYLVAAQLALSQFPAMLLPSAIGWVVGMAWRAELLPGLSPGSHGFRVPAWIVGEQGQRGGAAGTSGAAGAGGSGSAAERERFEDLRRRLEGEVAASTSGLESGGGQRRRGGGSGIMERLRGAW